MARWRHHYRFVFCSPHRFLKTAVAQLCATKTKLQPVHYGWQLCDMIFLLWHVRCFLLQKKEYYCQQMLAHAMQPSKCHGIVWPTRAWHACAGFGWNVQVGGTCWWNQDMLSKCLQVHQVMLSRCHQVHMLTQPRHADVFGLPIVRKTHETSHVEGMPPSANIVQYQTCKWNERLLSMKPRTCV